MRAPVFYFSALATLAVSSTAMAGGYTPPIIDETPVAVIVEPEPVLNWKGAYAGATLGYAFGGDDDVGFTRNGNNFRNPGSLELSGGNAGIHAGYRTQLTGNKFDWVIGGELSYEDGNIEDSFNKDNGFSRASNSVNSIAALRLKTGILNQAKNTLFYGILGVAQMDYDYRIAGIDGNTAFEVKDDSANRTGYIVGLGVERKLNDKWSVTGEYEYTNYGKETLKNDGSIYSTEETPDYSNVKVGLNYQF